MNNKIELLMNNLYDELEEAAYKYYNGLDSGMDDSVYDNRYDYLSSLEIRYPEYVRHGSITEQVGAKPLASLPIVRYEKPALSLDKRYDINEIAEYFRQNGVEYVNASLKCDGLTVLFTYDNGELIQAASRGGGLEGNDLTRQCRYLDSFDIPQHIEYKGHTVIRAEVMLPKAMLEIINAGLEEGETAYKSCRNLASGTIRNLDPTLTAKRKLCARTFQVVTHDGLEFKTHTAELEWAKKQGFKIVPNEVIHIDELSSYVDKVVEMRNTLDYDIDGLVFVVDELFVQHKFPDTSKTQGGKMAFKFPNKGSSTYVRSIDWQIGSTGKLTPVLNLDPIEFEGATVSRCTAHNLSYVLGNRDNGEKAPSIGIGSQIRLERAGEVIPKCGEVYYTSNAQPSSYPRYCPICGAPTFIEGVELYCSNPDCKGVLKKQLEIFVSKQCFNLKGLGEQTISQLVDLGFITKIGDIFNIWKHRDALINVDGFGVKTLDSIELQVRNTTSAELSNVIASLPIKGIGLSIGRILATRFTNLSDFVSFDGDYNVECEGIGEILNTSIKSFLSSDKGVAIIAAYMFNGIGTVNSSQISKEKATLEGRVFVITGTLSHERSYFEELIRKHGGKVTGSVSGKTNYLLAGSNVGATKLSKAAALGVDVISEDEFNEML